MPLSRKRLDDLYDEWNRPEFISPDPLETILSYGYVGDREVAALMASSMAYGKVAALLPPLRRILTVLGSSPRDYVLHRRESEITEDLEGIVHRFARPVHLSALLSGAGAVIRRFGSLEAAFSIGYSGSAGDVVGGLDTLEAALRGGAAQNPGHLLAHPSGGSACKRLLLFLRWMVRSDAVDPGGWRAVDTADLLLPLDTWTYRIALRAGWTKRRTPDMKTVREVSAALAEFNHEDPIKYDFALSRFGIRNGLDLDQLFAPG